MKKDLYSKSVSVLLLLGLLTSCSKGGVFGAGYLSDAGILGGSIDVPGSFSSYQPPGNSKMTELKSNISGANNDLLKTIGANTYYGPFADLASLEAALADETKGPGLKALMNSLGLSYKDCSSDIGIKITDGVLETTLEDAYVTQTEEAPIACSFSVTDYSAEIKDELSESEGSTASLTSGQEAGVTALLAHIQEKSGVVDCASNEVFSQEFKIADFQNECEFFQSKVQVGGIEQDYKVYDRISQRDELKKSLKYTIIQEIAADDSAGDIKIYAAKMIEKSPTLKKDLAKHVKKDAQDEILQVSLNSFMAHGVNIFSVLTYLGIDSSDALKTTGANVTKLKDIVEKYKYSIINTEVAKGDLFFAYKPGFRFFVDMFVAGKIDALDANGVVINDGDSATSEDFEKLRTASKFRYYINKENLCRFLAVNGTKDAEEDEIANTMSSCLTTIENYIDRMTVIHDMSTKKLSLYYVDSEYQFPQSKILDLVYTYNYNSDIRSDVDNLRKAYISVIKRELNGNLVALSDVEKENYQEQLEYLAAMTTNGMISMRDQIQVGGQTAGTQKSLTDIGLSNLASTLAFSVGDLTDPSSNEGLYIRIPENAPGDFDVDSDLRAVLRNSEGDVVIDIKKAERLFFLDHDRGNSIFKDRLGINIPELSAFIPPFELSQKDLLIGYLELDQYCDPGETAVPANYVGCEAHFSIVKPNVSNDALTLSNLLFKEYTTGHMG
ncbi:MAG: hypothetical protein KBD76_16585, partial [Bacteriovorax sp.]|nr:hypothetical protein [Bacteriovorax sp.]